MIGHYLEQMGHEVTYLDPLTEISVPMTVKGVVLLAHNQQITYGYSGVDQEQKMYCDIQDGSVIVDPWRKFKTKNGREVIDGRGVDPDISIEKEELSRLTALLFTKNILFNYATEYHAANKEIKGADEFRLTEEEYTAFKNYVIKEKLNYTSLAEEALIKLKDAAEKEGVFEEIKMEYEKTLEKVSPNQALDLEKKRQEIVELLENEIVSRYYYQKGRTINSFQHDPVVIKAIETAINKMAYDAILKN